KHNYIVKDVNTLAATIRNAFFIAREGRPGPVLIDVPKDVTAAMGEYSPLEVRWPKRTGEHLKNGAIAQLITLLKESKKPMLYVGGGVIRSNAEAELAEFIEKIDAPMGVSLMGNGAIDTTNERFTGMIGMHGTRLSNIAVNNCDLLLVIGARFSDRVVSKASAFARRAKIVHIDVDPAEINKNITTYYHVIGDSKVILSKINAQLTEPIKHTEWMEQIAKWRDLHPMKINGETRRPSQILGALSELMEEDSVLVTEVGQHQMWAAQFFRHTPSKRFLTSGGLGTMGYGTGAAIGAQVGNPNRRVVNVAGDGSFRMNCNELATIARYRLPVIILVMNNRTLGMVRQWQTLFYEERYSETTLDTDVDWIALAKAYGVHGLHLTKDDDPHAILSQAFAHGGPVLIDCEIPLDNMVYPMVAPGASIEEMID
ncbi:MAG: acetolactate synthase large subunit, partial [Spirochaetales bacterium]|nr:acetolactate synthase large subunit [Spirochaetales bacterium]